MLLHIFMLFISVMRSLINIQNIVGESESPYLTPFLLSNQSVCILFNFTHTVGFEYNDFIAS